MQNHDANDTECHDALDEIELVRKRIACRFTWVSSYHSDFIYDFCISSLPEKIAAGSVTAWKISRAAAALHDDADLICNGTIEEHHDPRSA